MSLNDLTENEWRNLDPAQIDVTLNAGPVYPDLVARIAKLREALKNIARRSLVTPQPYDTWDEVLKEVIGAARVALDEDQKGGGVII